MDGYDGILNNDMLIKSLKTAVRSGRVGHAYIFDGEKGSGKTSVARAFAKTLNCEAGGDAPCGVCASCRAFDDNNNPDVIYISEEKSIKVDTVREQINAAIMTRPFSYRYKVFVISDADTMNPQAQNAFLKTLEEPPSFAVFLLLCQNFNKLLPTILSRCILFKLRPLPQPMLKKYLTDRGFTAERADTLSHYARGIVGRTLELDTDEGFADLTAAAFDICTNIKKWDIVELFSNCGVFAKDRRGDIDTLLRLMYYIFRDALIYKTTGNTQHLIHSTRLDRLDSVCAAFSTRQLMKACDALEQARGRMAVNGSIQYVVEELFYRIKER
ncbi:MAG: DNA polymerase III subunit delta' [Firmicutes bacterium]|nr:DNA polymerase III subunit delta' [Bacillota bacterium]